jgi:hypothetical protein
VYPGIEEIFSLQVVERTPNSAAASVENVRVDHRRLDVAVSE